MLFRSVATSYSSGVQVYYNGNFYTANTSTASSFTASEWDKVNIPKIFQNYLIRGIYSDYLRANGQLEAASIEDNNANGMLVMESDKLYRQQGQVRTTKMVTY